MSGHTPGPWVAEFNGYYWQVNPANKRPEDPWQIGDVCASEPETRPSSLQEANAKLFAAAPALLAALKYAKRKLESCARLHGNDKVAVASLLEPIDAAIALAEGPQP